MAPTDIREKYELEKMPIRIGGMEIGLFSIKLESFTDHLLQAEDIPIEAFPLWIKVWESAIILADHLMKHRPEKEKRILEIGAGMGITGLFLGVCGFDVTVTDYDPEALQLLQLNVDHNGLDHVTVEKLDWYQPELDGRYDIICGSELIYKEAFFKPLVRLFCESLHPDGVIYLAHDIRRWSLMKFIGMAADFFCIENTVRVLKGNQQTSEVVLHKLMHRPGPVPSVSGGGAE